MLMGVVVNNAIVMLEKITQLKNAGMDHYIAVSEACKTRLRPILKTTLTTILALIHLAIGVGHHLTTPYPKTPQNPLPLNL